MQLYSRSAIGWEMLPSFGSSNLDAVQIGLAVNTYTSFEAQEGFIAWPCMLAPLNQQTDTNGACKSHYTTIFLSGVL